MIPIGHAINGDIVVLRIHNENCSVGLISHDEFWEGESDPNQTYVEVAASIDEYLFRVAEKLYLPIDFYAAKEWADLKQERFGVTNV